MSIVKSFSVGNGDMFYIEHGSDNFTIIDCYLSDYNKKEIVGEIKNLCGNKGITRFISTHPDEDHIGGLDYLNSENAIANFYCVKNEATKSEKSEAFKKYCELRDSDKAFYIYKGCSRKWMNIADKERGSSGINILWPDTENIDFKEELLSVKEGESPNNISPIISYNLENGVTMLWMGDLETDFMNKIKDSINLPKIDILFAPHHGRESGKVPIEMLKKMDPKIIIIGEAPSDKINYYNNYNTITQLSAGDIIFECKIGKVHIYVGEKNYSVNYLYNEKKSTFDNYLGTLKL